MKENFSLFTLHIFQEECNMEPWKTQRTEVLLDTPWVKVRRELLEETGYVSDCWEYLGPTVESSAHGILRAARMLGKD